jgi:hypothetical protein
MKLRYEHNKGFHDTCLVYLGNDQKRDFFRDFHKRDKLRIKSATFYPVIHSLHDICKAKHRKRFSENCKFHVFWAVFLF